MSYRFDGVDDVIEFAYAPFSGHTFGAFTIASLFKRSVDTSVAEMVGFFGSALNQKLRHRTFGTTLNLRSNLDSFTGPSVSSTTVWYLTAVTHAAGSGTVRFHVHDGTSWSHSNGTPTTYADVDSVARLLCGQDTGGGTFDMACCGVKKGDSSDATIETLSRTAFSAWTGFTFDWLIGFDTSLTSAGVLQDQGAAGTGDQIAITGTSVVADPPGWSWAGTPASTFVPQIVIA